jgi:hypothetical protein
MSHYILIVVITFFNLAQFHIIFTREFLLVFFLLITKIVSMYGIFFLIRNLAIFYNIYFIYND